LSDGSERKEEEADSWQWGGESYIVKNAYMSLIEGDSEDPTCAGDVWNPLIPLRLSTFARRLFQNRLPTKDNLRRSGIDINSSIFCVGGCDELESEENLFFNCPNLSMAWKEIARWLGISLAFDEVVCSDNLYLWTVIFSTGASKRWIRFLVFHLSRWDVMVDLSYCSSLCELLGRIPNPCFDAAEL
ncbi:DNA-directed RNA polymerase, partial [Trifolium pratense]